MSKLPKLKFESSPWFPNAEVLDIEEAKYSIFGVTGALLWVDGQAIKSYEQLIQLAAQDCYRDKEFLEAVFFLPLSGG